MPQDRTRSSLELLLSISRELATSLELRSVLARVLSLSTTNVGAERGSMIVLNDAGQPVEAAISVNDQVYHPTVQVMQDILDHGLAGKVAQSRQPALIPDTSQDERWTRRPDDALERTGSKSAICVPLFSSGQLTGVLTLVHAKPGFFNKLHLEVLEGIADLAGIAVRNAHLYRSTQEAQRRYRELFEDSVDPILITNWEGHILEANRQALIVSGYTSADLLKLNVFDLYHGRAEDLDAHAGSLGAGKTIKYESRLVRQDSSPLPVEFYLRQVCIGDEKSLQWILRDISERKQLDALRDDLAAMIYHDLRSPLANIISSLDILSTMLPTESRAPIQPIFQITTRATDRLQRLISSLLDINRLETGQPITNKHQANPRNLVLEAAETVRALMEIKQQTLTLDLQDELPVIVVDVDMIRRVLINLLENAMKFTPSEGNISVGCKLTEKGSLYFWVKDSGSGIPEDALELIFEKFNRLQGDHYPKGLGLGLAFCRLAVQAHGGKIWVESKTDLGSKFSFSLPVV